MLTGDNRRTAEAVARKLGIDDVVADVITEEKHRVVQQLRADGHVVAMAGNGVNDAPALAAAEARARKLSRATMRNIRENLFFAFIYNALGVPIAAGVLYPVLGILLSPAIAALAMALSSVSVIGALRLRTIKI